MSEMPIPKGMRFEHAINPDSEEYDLPDIDKARVIALQLSVQFHGASAMNPKATPSSKDQVIITADTFLEYITDEQY